MLPRVQQHAGVIVCAERAAFTDEAWTVCLVADLPVSVSTLHNSHGRHKCSQFHYPVALTLVA